MNDPPIAHSAMRDQTLALGAVMIEEGGWHRPASFGDVEGEVSAMRRAVGLFDDSPIGKIRLQGKSTEDAMGAALTAPPPPLGAVAEAAPDGRPMLAARLADDDWLILTEPGGAERVLALVERSGCSHGVDVTSALACARLTGPNAASALAGVTDLDLDPARFPDRCCAQAMVAETRGALMRLDVGGLLSYAVLFGRDYGEHVWESLAEAGAPHGLAPVGLSAMRMVANGAHPSDDGGGG